MTLKLDKVNRGPHLSTLVASSISREIVQGRLKPGDQLPTEQQLAQTFGVSRNVVREAIARLRSEGRIWSQQGRGAFVADQPNATVLTIDYRGAAAGRCLPVSLSNCAASSKLKQPRSRPSAGPTRRSAGHERRARDHACRARTAA